MKYYIYSITFNEDPSLFYIGSTNNFSRRKSHHKKNVTNKRGKLYWSRLYFFIREKKGWSNFKMEIIETGETDDIKEIEQKFINERKPPLNTHKAKIIE